MDFQQHVWSLVPHRDIFSQKKSRHGKFQWILSNLENCYKIATWGWLAWTLSILLHHSYGDKVSCGDDEVIIWTWKWYDHDDDFAADDDDGGYGDDDDDGGDYDGQDDGGGGGDDTDDDADYCDDDADDDGGDDVMVMMMVMIMAIIMMKTMIIILTKIMMMIRKGGGVGGDDHDKTHLIHTVVTPIYPLCQKNFVGYTVFAHIVAHAFRAGPSDCHIPFSSKECQVFRCWTDCCRDKTVLQSQGTVLICTKLTLSLLSSKGTFSQPFKEKCVSEVARICSIIIFHLSKLLKVKFSLLCAVIFLVRLQEKFDSDHSQEWKG